MKFKKGDVVYAIGPTGKIFKAKIKGVHPKLQPDMPYELDVKSRARHYPEDAVFDTRKEAEQQITKDNLSKVEDALQHKGAMRMVQAVTPNEDGSYYGNGGQIIKPDFELTEDETKELTDLASKLDMWLASHNIPYMICIVTAKTEDDDGEHVGMRRTACFPGPRTPTWLKAFYGLLEGFLNYGATKE